MIARLRHYQLLLRITIFVLPFLSFYLASYICSHALHLSFAFSSAEFLYLALFTTMVWSIVAERYNVTSITKVSAENTGLRASFAACGITYLIDLVALFLVKQLGYSRLLFILSAAILLFLTLVTRTLFRILVRELAGRRLGARVIVVGAGQTAVRTARRLERNEFVRCEIAGYVQLPGETVRATNAPVFGLEDIDAIERLRVDEILIAVPPDCYSDLRRCIEKLNVLCKPIRIVVNPGNGAKVRERVLEMGHLQMLDLDPGPSYSIGYFLVKRSFDLIFASLIIALTAVPMLVIAILVKLSSPGPILFRQNRVGKNGKVFAMYKFRTMKVANNTEGDTRWTTENDPRRTRTGTFLRKTSLDELPQFFNVLKCEMSVVGPRPERPHFVKKFRGDIALYQARHHLNVGITGWAQVNGLRGDTSITKRLRYDLYYLQNWSLMFDLRIIVMTLWCGFISKNAY